MDIGEQDRVIIVEPLADPTPAPVTTPAPAKEPVPSDR